MLPKAVISWDSIFSEFSNQLGFFFATMSKVLQFLKLAPLFILRYLSPEQPNSVWAWGDYDADSDSSVFFSNMVNVPESWGQAASVNIALWPSFSPLIHLNAEDGDVNCVWYKWSITKGLPLLWQIVQSVCHVTNTAWSHRRVHTLCHK